ncbi:MAG: VCBS repeat-containing protein, partial [Planctomycetaceae bacterium]
ETTGKWGDPVAMGKVAGKVSSARAVDINGDGKLCLFIASDGGDKLFQFKDGKSEDITAARKLTAKSQSVVWADFNFDGKLDLLSFDGKGLSLHTQQADGTFASSPLDAGDALKGGCTELVIAPNTKEGRQVIIVTAAGPLSLIISKDSKAVAKPLIEGEFPGKDLGAADKCFVADLDGDAVADMLQVFAGGSLFYKGKADGLFAVPVKSQIVAGKGRAAVCMGDYDGDGLLDVFTTAEDGNKMWQNLGGGKFAESLNWCGELTYISKPGGIYTAMCDINNDGRQGILITYDNMSPQIFFNRGFRSFGHSHTFELVDVKLASGVEVSAGQQTACIADFKGNGLQDTVLVLKDGSVCYLPYESAKEGVVAVTIALPPNSPNEPVLVTVKNAKRSFGAFNVTAAQPAFVGLPAAGAITVTWTLPGQKPQSKEVEAMDTPVRFVIGEGK